MVIVASLFYNYNYNLQVNPNNIEMRFSRRNLYKSKSYELPEQCFHQQDALHSILSSGDLLYLLKTEKFVFLIQQYILKQKAWLHKSKAKP